MKKTQILLTILLLLSFVTTLKPSSVLNIHSNLTRERELQKLADERNAQIEKSQEISRDQNSQEQLIGEFKLTFYTPSPDETDNSPLITATGARVKPGITVAVDPSYWELGTKFYIEGYGYVIAEDTGSKIKGPHAMDVCVETKNEAFQNGVQYRKVWVVKA